MSSGKLHFQLILDSGPLVLSSSFDRKDILYSFWAYHFWLISVIYDLYYQVHSIIVHILVYNLYNIL